MPLLKEFVALGEAALSGSQTYTQAGQAAHLGPLGDFTGMTQGILDAAQRVEFVGHLRTMFRRDQNGASGSQRELRHVIRRGAFQPKQETMVRAVGSQLFEVR